MASVINDKIKQPGSGFTNLQSYLRANQAGRLGQAVRSGVSNVVGQGQQSLGQAKQQFQQKSQAGSVGGQQDLAQIKEAVQRAGQGPTDEDVKKFERIRQGYQGPKGLEDSNLGMQTQEAQDIARMSQSAGGRQGMLQRFVGKPEYTAGQQRFDTMLLGQQGQQDLRQARRQALQFGRQAQTEQEKARQQALMLGAQAKDIQQAAESELTQAETGLMGDIEARRKLYETEGRTAQDVLRRMLSPESEEQKDQPITYSTPDENEVQRVAANIRAETGEEPDLNLIRTSLGRHSVQLPKFKEGQVSQEEFDATMRALERSGVGAGGTFFRPFSRAGYDPKALIAQNPLEVTKEQATTEADKARYLALRKLGAKQAEAFTPESQVGGKLAAPVTDNISSVGETIKKEEIDPAQKALAGSEERLQHLTQLQGMLQAKRNYENRLNPLLGKEFRSEEEKQQLEGLLAQKSQMDKLQQRINDWTTGSLHLGEDAFRYGGPGDAMAAKMEEAKRDIAKQQQVLGKYGPATTLEQYLRSRIR